MKYFILPFLIFTLTVMWTGEPRDLVDNPVKVTEIITQTVVYNDIKNLPAEAVRVLELFKKEEYRIRLECDKKVELERIKLIKWLEAAKVNATKTGNLEVALACKSVIAEISTPENALVQASHQNTFSVLSARYGIDTKWIDATEYVRAKIVNGNLELADHRYAWRTVGDPAPGARKGFEITIKINNEEKIFKVGFMEDFFFPIKPSGKGEKLNYGDIDIEGNSMTGTVIGLVTKGQTIRIQYLSGKWKSWGRLGSENPDATIQERGDACRVAILINERQVGLVPPETFNDPYFFKVQLDGTLSFRINDQDGDWSTNPKATVKYRISR